MNFNQDLTRRHGKTPTAKTGTSIAHSLMLTTNPVSSDLSQQKKKSDEACDETVTTADLSTSFSLRENSGKLTSRSTTITFNLQANTIHEIDHLSDLSEDTILAVWYTPLESREMKKEMARDCTALRKSNNVIETTRGLERSADPVRWHKRMTSKDTSINVVLTQQYRCRHVLEADLVIASVYNIAARLNKIDALEQGRRDEAEVAVEHEALRKKLKKLPCYKTKKRGGFGGIRKLIIQRSRA